MAKRPAINLNKIPKGDQLQFVKSFDGEGKVCANGAVMFGVDHDGKSSNLFIEKNEQTSTLINKLGQNRKGAFVTIFCNDDDYQISFADVVLSDSIPNGTVPEGYVEPDWQNIARGKVRHGVGIAFISQGRTLDEHTINEMEAWVNYIMDGRTTEPVEEDLPF